jgi:thiosulfate/3-mercaptopyruvate sulfurtransferase
MLDDAQWLAQHINDPDLVVIQVDQRREGYDGGHIPGARDLPYTSIAIEINGLPVELPSVDALRDAFALVGVTNGSRIVLYGAPLSAARAWVTLDYLGLSDRAAMLDGGIVAWRTSGGSLVTDVPAVRPGTLAVTPQPAKIVGADWVRERSADPAYALIDGRPLREFTGEDGGQNGQYLAGHIPGAEHLYWEELMVSAADPRLLPIERLRTRFDTAGATAGRTVVAYCFIGMRASMLYYVSRLLGHETRLYDGSWHDWSARGMPVETGL